MSFEDWQRQTKGCDGGPCKGCADGGLHDWDLCHCHDPVAP